MSNYFFICLFISIIITTYVKSFLNLDTTEAINIANYKRQIFNKTKANIYTDKYNKVKRFIDTQKYINLGEEINRHHRSTEVTKNKSVNVPALIDEIIQNPLTTIHMENNNITEINKEANNYSYLAKSGTSQSINGLNSIKNNNDIDSMNSGVSSFVNETEPFNKRISIHMNVSDEDDKKPHHHCESSWFGSNEIKNLDEFIDVVAMKTCERIKAAMNLDMDCAKVKDRIVGGDPILIDDFPYIAQYDGKCGCSILSRMWLITAAHCTESGDYVRVGNTFAGLGTKYYIKRHITHPSYKPEENYAVYDYDFQLLELKTPLKFTSQVQPIQLGESADIKAGKFATVLGWGLSNEGNVAGSSELRAVSVPIIKNRICRKTANGYFENYITKRMLCAGFREGGKDACQGDSGGPLVHNRRLIGVVSFGIGCARPKFPGVYSRIPSVRKWIYDYIGKNNTFP